MGAERKVDRDSRGKLSPRLAAGPARYPDRALAALAAAQHGQVTRRQLLQLGLSADAIDRRLALHRLHVVHRGVLSIVPRELMSAHAHFMAAVLAGGDGAVLSYRSAAALWGIRPSTASVLDITSSRRLGRRAGIRAHRVILPGDERSRVLGIPVTSPARTQFDLAAVLQPHELERAIEHAGVLRLWDTLSLADLIERHPGCRGVATVRAVLAARKIGARVTRSELERDFLALLDQAGVPLPESNAWLTIAGRSYEADCLWRAQRLVVELDSRTFHDTPGAFERDRVRDRRLAVLGWQTLRVTARQLQLEPAAVIADLAALLAAAARAA